MASPPYARSPSALSPPYPSPAPLPNKKRPADINGGSAPSLKRRKASNLSVTSATSAHPLRQTSFPPEGGQSPFPRSPSVDSASHVSGSQVSAATGAKKRRGRKAIAADAGSKEATPSLVGGRAPTTVSGTPGDKDQAAEEEDEADGPLELVDATARTQEQKQEEIRLRAMLVEAMDPEQLSRYELWRASKLTDAIIKRLVNATVSQSVPANVVLAVRSVSKLFAGILIEQAREVQAEWIAATGEEQADVPEPPAVGTAANEDGTPKEPRRGPLRPDHLREAWARYKSSAEGGAVGLHALWHSQQEDGVERFGTRTGGRRIFR